MRHLLNRTALVLIGAAMILTSAPAEENKVELKEIDVENEVELEEIAVTATRAERSSFDIPNAVSSVSLEEFQRRMPISLVDALIDEAGVYSQRTTNGQGSPFIRNFTGYHTLMLIDGVRLNNWTFRSGPNQYFNTQNVDDIERVKSCAARVLFYTAIRQSAALSTRFRAARFS